MEISPIKITDLARIADVEKSVVSKYFKEANENNVCRKNNRIVGIYRNAAAQFLRENGIICYQKGGVIDTANLCGGVGKTTGTHSLAIALSRIVSENEPIVIIDTDSQGSLTKTVVGTAAADHEAILIDFLEGKASIKDILTPLGNNIWFIKSNLNQVYIDKVLSKPGDIKNAMLNFYKNIFEHLGDNTKIFQDHTPQLSNIFASSICALHALPNNMIKAVLVPMRSDDYAFDGADKILKEIIDLKETYNFEQNIDIHCYFSSIDKRVSTTTQAINTVKKNERIMRYLSPVVIRYCAEIPKSIQSSSNVYSTSKSNKASEDYQDLLQSIFNYQPEAE